MITKITIESIPTLSFDHDHQYSYRRIGAGEHELSSKAKFLENASKVCANITFDPNVDIAHVIKKHFGNDAKVDVRNITKKSRTYRYLSLVITEVDN